MAGLRKLDARHARTQRCADKSGSWSEQLDLFLDPCGHPRPIISALLKTEFLIKGCNIGRRHQAKERSRLGDSIYMINHRLGHSCSQAMALVFGMNDDVLKVIIEVAITHDTPATHHRFAIKRADGEDRAIECLLGLLGRQVMPTHRFAQKAILVDRGRSFKNRVVVHLRSRLPIAAL